MIPANGCPCYYCENREINCHSACSRYKDWVEINKQARLNRQKIEQLERWRSKK